MHSGHRERLKAKFSNGELEPHELLELLLFYSIPRVNTNELAHALINKCGGISKVFSSPKSTLMEVDGIGENSAVLIRTVGELMGVCAQDNSCTDNMLTNRDRLYDYIKSIFFGQCREKTFMLMFSAKKRFIGQLQIGDGFYFQNQVLTYDAVAAAVRKKAKYVIIAHNHPNDVLMPSDTDMETSNKINFAFENFGISVLCHFVVAQGSCVSYQNKMKI